MCPQTKIFNRRFRSLLTEKISQNVEQNTHKKMVKTSPKIPVEK